MRLSKRFQTFCRWSKSQFSNFGRRTETTRRARIFCPSAQNVDWSLRCMMILVWSCSFFPKEKWFRFTISVTRSAIGRKKDDRWLLTSLSPGHNSLSTRSEPKKIKVVLIAFQLLKDYFRGSLPNKNRLKLQGEVQHWPKTVKVALISTMLVYPTSWQQSLENILSQPTILTTTYKNTEKSKSKWKKRWPRQSTRLRTSMSTQCCLKWDRPTKSPSNLSPLSHSGPIRMLKVR